MRQRNLFDEPSAFEQFAAVVRPSDPATSHVAADEVASKLAGLRREFVEGVRRCGGSATANEAAAAMSGDHSIRESIRKRAKECVDRGLVKIEAARVCNVSGSLATVYEVVE